MPRGVPKEWTIDELRTVWEHDPKNSELTVDELSEEMGVQRGTWYAIKSRLNEFGGPDALFAEMQEGRIRRYKHNGDGTGVKHSLEAQLSHTYVIRTGNAGRSGNANQYTVTIPPKLAEAFIKEYGNTVLFVPQEEGILIKPVLAAPLVIPEWLKNEDDGND